MFIILTDPSFWMSKKPMTPCSHDHMWSNQFKTLHWGHSMWWNHTCGQTSSTDDHMWSIQFMTLHWGHSWCPAFSPPPCRGSPHSPRLLFHPCNIIMQMWYKSRYFLGKVGWCYVCIKGGCIPSFDIETTTCWQNCTPGISECITRFQTCANVFKLNFKLDIYYISKLNY